MFDQIFSIKTFLEQNFWKGKKQTLSRLSKLNKVDKRFTESIARAVRYNKTLRNRQSGRPKKSLVVKEKALKEILRPLWTTNTKRPRSIILFKFLYC